MYLIPKNVKVKKEIFRGFGILEILVMAGALLLGFLFQSLTSNFKIKVFLFCFLPMLTFLLLFPLPNGTTTFIILKKFFIYTKNPKKYKLK